MLINYIHLKKINHLENETTIRLSEVRIKCKTQHNEIFGWGKIKFYNYF